MENRDIGYILKEERLNEIYDRLILNGVFSNEYNKPKIWKVPDKKSPEPAPGGNQRPDRLSKLEILAPLDKVFVDDALKDDIVVRTAIPELLYGTQPDHSGVILYGPPGTGKTVLLKAIRDVYHNAGAYAQEVSVSAINSHFVGDLARNLEEHLKTALGESKRRGKPSFVFFDEASILAQKANDGANSVAKHYQEALDVLKRYIGNERDLVVAISTNLLSESFEDALTREGRLTSFLIGYPDDEQRKRMWKHFAREYGVFNLDDSQATQLATATPQEQGAFVEEFCRKFKNGIKAGLLRQRGYSTFVEALKADANVTKEQVNQAINFEVIYRGVSESLKAKFIRDRALVDEVPRIGFGAGK